MNEQEKAGNEANQMENNPGQEGTNNSSKEGTAQDHNVGQQEDTTDRDETGTSKQKREEEEANRDANQGNPAIGAGTE